MAGKTELQVYLPCLAAADVSGFDREVTLLRLLQMTLGPDRRHIVPTLLLRLGGTWGEKLSRAVLQELGAGLSLSPTDYAPRANWQQLMKASALRLPLTLAQATSMWPPEIAQTSLRETVDEFCAVIEFRRSIHRHFKGER